MPKKQSDGRYRAKILCGKTATGKPIYKYVSATTQSELTKKKQTISDQLNNDEMSLSNREALFGDYALVWFDKFKNPVLSASARESYKTALNKDIFPIFAERKIASIKTSELQDFINSFSGTSKTKIATIKAALNGVFRTACADKVIKENPMVFVVRPKAKDAKEKFALTQEQRKAIEDTCITSDDGLFLACLYYLGCRQGEARGLMWNDIDWDNNLIHIQRDIDNHDCGRVGSLKTPQSERWIPIPSPLQRLLKSKCGANNSYLFKGELTGEPWGKTVAERKWCSLCVEAGLAEELSEKNGYEDRDIRSHFKPTITPHYLRHNYITMCFENDIDVYTTMKLVGHKSYKTTMDIYTHLTKKKLGKAGKQVDDMFKNK